MASWEGAPYLGRVAPAHPGGNRLAVEVLLADSAGDQVRVHASGWTVDALAEREVARRLGSDHTQTDWRPA